MSDVDDAIAAARSSWSRIADTRGEPVDTRQRRKTTQAIGKRLTRIAVADAAILIGAVIVGMIARSASWARCW